MADDQATLGRFARADEGTGGTGGEGEGDGADDPDGSPDSDDAGGAATAESQGTAPADGPPEAPACPWCLAPASAFEDGGLTGRRCGRCAATLPVDADWFAAGEVVARRPMYDPDVE